MKIFIALFLVLMTLSGCNLETDRLDPFSVELRVDGTVLRANIAYVLNSVSYATPNCTLPFSADASLYSGGTFLLTAQGLDAAGDLTVTVTIDGIPFMSETTIVPFGFVAIYGVIP